MKYFEESFKNIEIDLDKIIDLTLLEPSENTVEKYDENMTEIYNLVVEMKRKLKND